MRRPLLLEKHCGRLFQNPESIPKTSQIFGTETKIAPEPMHNTSAVEDGTRRTSFHRSAHLVSPALELQSQFDCAFAALW